MHLGLHVPKCAREPLKPPCVTLKVGGHEETWVPDKVIVFDDSFEHEVKYTIEEGEVMQASVETERVVLGMQVTNPDYALKYFKK